MFDKTNIQNSIGPYLHKLRAYLLTLRDVRNVGLLVFTVILLLITWSGIKSIQTNYGLQKQIARLQQENSVQQLEDANLAFRNQYYATDQYKEITARQNLGLGAPGETELLISKDVALAHTTKQADSTAAKSQVPKQPLWQRNFQGWIDFFLHRGVTVD
jgi:cell division protein FtsB